SIVGEVTADIRESRFDRNLLSTRDDADNDGTYYDLGLNRRWLWNGKGSTLSLKRRLKQAAYRDRSRINAADFDREYLLPFGYSPDADELLHRGNLTLTPLSWLRTTSFFSTLDYRDAFTSRTGGVAMSASPTQRLQLDASWAGISADLDSAGIKGDGTANTYIGSARYNVYRSVTLGSRFERDIRQNNYSADEHGTRYSRMELEAGTVTEDVLYEYYAEDSIIGEWTDVLRRNRITGTSVRNFGRLSYDLMLSYQWLEQQSSTLDNFLGRLGLGYQNPPSRLNITASYLVSEENRNARGITYLEVEPGQGNYILEDGQYLPDPDGNYIQVEEILSNSARVRRGEKSFQISKNWSAGLFRFNSRIEEELLEGGERKIWWAVPFLSDADQPYLFFSRRYDGDVRLIPVAGFYVINLSASEDLEKRDIAGATRRRRDIKGRLSLKQKLRETYFEEYAEPFSAERDEYYSASGDVDGLTVGANLRQLISTAELTLGGSYRRATSKADERSDIYAITTGSRFPVISRGELRANLELYRQVFENLSGNPSYQLTGNRPGEKGAIWSVAFNYGIRAGLRINFSLSGRHSDNRTARLFARGEVVAGF
ncbi:MAG: hypothetical protein PVH24_06130, partial [Candidatus Zixiibacteriota bacterium]